MCCGCASCLKCIHLVSVPAVQCAATVRLSVDVAGSVCPAGDVVRTELRLVLCYRGWEYTILKRDTTHADAGPEQTIRVMVSSCLWMAQAGNAAGHSGLHVLHDALCIAHASWHCATSPEPGMLLVQGWLLVSRVGLS